MNTFTNSITFKALKYMFPLSNEQKIENAKNSGKLIGNVELPTKTIYAITQ